MKTWFIFTFVVALSVGFFRASAITIISVPRSIQIVPVSPPIVVSPPATVPTVPTIPDIKIPPIVSPPTPEVSAQITIDQIIADMSMPSEAMVIDPRFEWQSKPVIQMYAPRWDAIPDWWTGNRPEWTHDAITWFTAFEAEGNRAHNSRIQVANLRLYVFSESTRKWSRVDFRESPLVDTWEYPFSYNGESSGARNETSGGISIKPKYPRFHHGYGNPITINPHDVRATYVAMDFRLVVDDPSKPDDRKQAKYVVDSGADYYPGNNQGGWGMGYAPAMGNGRMLLVTENWRTATLLVPNFRNGCSFEEMKNNPPPME